MQKPDIPLQALVAVSRQAACEGVVLLKNTQNVLPLRSDEEVSLFGRCQVDTYRSGTGSGGAVNVPYAINALAGLRANAGIIVNEELAAVYEAWVAEHPFDDGGGRWAAEPWFQAEMPLADELAAAAARRSSKAVIIVGRTGGEDVDYADEQGSYRLTELEQAMVGTVTAHFQRVIVVLNTTNIIDMSWLEQIEGAASIQAVLSSWAGGMESGHALADVLSGDVSPSGRMADTVAYHLADYPSSANFGSKQANAYAEDIYVGYRYFETFKPEAVQYAFGAGLSYTQFFRELLAFSCEGSGADQVVHVDVRVTNSGDQYAGKEVVQLYCEAPQGALGKPARVLAGFAKTDVLPPGASQTLSIRVPLASLASYDDGGASGHRSCYVLETGDYYFYLGSSVREAQRIADGVHLERCTVVEQLAEAMAPIRDFDRLRPGVRQPSGVYSEVYEPTPQRTIDLAQRINDNLPPILAQTGDTGIRLADVKHGGAPMEHFVAQFSNQDLAELVQGEGMSSPKATPGTAGAIGGSTNALYAFGLPVLSAADGPSGIRMDSGHKASQVPIGTMLACTWNTALNQQLFRLVGDEMSAYHIDTLLGPGINIHRHPLNGRNFEYFSEDPFLSGMMAAAQTNGLAAAGVSGTLKHFAANDQETARHDVDSVASERCLREIHLKPFEMAVKQGQASSIMTAYNPINGHWAASNYDLNTTILRGEWGYTGIVMSDWWAKINHNVEGGESGTVFGSYMIRAQNDLYMVVENATTTPLKDQLLAALADGSLTLGELQRSAMNICRFIIAAPAMKRPLVAYDPIKPFSARQSGPADAVVAADGIIFNATTNTSRVMKVTRAGVYKVTGRARNPRDPAAQATCTLSLNGEYAMVMSVNGTEGKWVDVDGVELRLEAGFYRLALDFVKPGAEVARLSFALCAS